jgi:archaellum component FlaC
MEQRVALMKDIETRTGIMDREMEAIKGHMDQMRQHVRGIDSHLSSVRTDVGNISVNMDIMHNEVQAMSHEMSRVAKPARTINKMFPFP